MRNFAPSELSNDKRTELLLAIFQLREFAHGYNAHFLVAGFTHVGVPARMFYVDSLRQYCANFYFMNFSRGDDTNLLKTLDKFELRHLAKPVDELLATNLGSSTFGELLRTYRDVFLVHKLFQIAPLEKRFYPKFDVRDDEKMLRYNKLEDDLFLETERLLYGLRELYPDLWY